MITLIACAMLVAVDGDTVNCDGAHLRLLGDGVPNVIGVDTPEIRHAECDSERRLGELAKERLQELIETPGMVIEDSGEMTRQRRPRRLVRVRMPDGRTAGAILQEEGLAGVWSREDGQEDWCG